MALPLAVCFYAVREGKVLAVSRPNEPTKFGLPGGKVEKGETLEEAVMREVREETGYVLGEVREVFNAVCEGEVTYEAITFVGHILGQVQAKEALTIEWVPRSVLLDGPFGPYNRKLFEVVDQLGPAIPDLREDVLDPAEFESIKALSEMAAEASWPREEGGALVREIERLRRLNETLLAENVKLFERNGVLFEALRRAEKVHQHNEWMKSRIKLLRLDLEGHVKDGLAQVLRSLETADSLAVQALEEEPQP